MNTRPHANSLIGIHLHEENGSFEFGQGARQHHRSKNGLQLLALYPVTDAAIPTFIRTWLH